MLGQTGREQGGCSRCSSLKYSLEQSVQKAKNASVGPRDGMDSSGMDGRRRCAAELAPGHGAVILPLSLPLWLLHVLCPSRLFPSQMLSLTLPFCRALLSYSYRGSADAALACSSSSTTTCLYWSRRSTRKKFIDFVMELAACIEIIEMVSFLCINLICKGLLGVLAW